MEKDCDLSGDFQQPCPQRAGDRLGVRAPRGPECEVNASARASALPRPLALKSGLLGEPFIIQMAWSNQNNWVRISGSGTQVSYFHQCHQESLAYSRTLSSGITAFKHSICALQENSK